MHEMGCWNQSEVQNWLATNGCAEMYSKAFAERNIDGETLMAMTMEELLVDVLQVDPEDIDDDMRGVHQALLDKIWNAVMDDYTPQTPHMMDGWNQSEVQNWLAANGCAEMYSKVFADGEIDEASWGRPRAM